MQHTNTPITELLEKLKACLTDEYLTKQELRKNEYQTYHRELINKDHLEQFIKYISMQLDNGLYPNAFIFNQLIENLNKNKKSKLANEVDTLLKRYKNAAEQHSRTTTAPRSIEKSSHLLSDRTQFPPLSKTVDEQSLHQELESINQQNPTSANRNELVLTAIKIKNKITSPTLRTYELLLDTVLKCCEDADEKTIKQILNKEGIKQICQWLEEVKNLEGEKDASVIFVIKLICKSIEPDTGVLYEIVKFANEKNIINNTYFPVKAIINAFSKAKTEKPNADHLKEIWKICQKREYKISSSRLYKSLIRAMGNSIKLDVSWIKQIVVKAVKNNEFDIFTFRFAFEAFANSNSVDQVMIETAFAIYDMMRDGKVRRNLGSLKSAVACYTYAALLDLVAKSEDRRFDEKAFELMKQENENTFNLPTIQNIANNKSQMGDFRRNVTFGMLYFWIEKECLGKIKQENSSFELTLNWQLKNEDSKLELVAVFQSFEKAIQLLQSRKPNIHIQLSRRASNYSELVLKLTNKPVNNHDAPPQVQSSSEKEPMQNPEPLQSSQPNRETLLTLQPPPQVLIPTNPSGFSLHILKFFCSPEQQQRWQQLLEAERIFVGQAHIFNEEVRSFQTEKTQFNLEKTMRIQLFEQTKTKLELQVDEIRQHMTTSSSQQSSVPHESKDPNASAERKTVPKEEKPLPHPPQSIPTPHPTVPQQLTSPLQETEAFLHDKRLYLEKNKIDFDNNKERLKKEKEAFQIEKIKYQDYVNREMETITLLQKMIGIKEQIQSLEKEKRQLMQQYGQHQQEKSSLKSPLNASQLAQDYRLYQPVPPKKSSQEQSAAPASTTSKSNSNPFT